METRFFWQMESPLGLLTLWSDGSALTGLAFPGEARARTPALLLAGSGRPEGNGPRLTEHPGPFVEARRQLDEYFSGGRREFTIPLGIAGTIFQRRVWEELGRIPFGETISYAELARRIGSPRSVRAVGGANGRNPLPIVIPCHRVIGSDGRLTGFGGGLPLKEQLLAFERTGRWEPATALLPL